MKTIVIYHSIDLDGWMSAAIVKKWYEDQCKLTNQTPIIIDLEKNYTGNAVFPKGSLCTLGFNYGDKIPKLSQFDKVIMTDISFPKEEMSKINQRLGDKFIWIDHHQRTIDEINKFIIKEGISMEGSVTEPGELKAACELTWHYFYPYLGSDDASFWKGMPEIIRLLGRYDCFGHKGTDEEQKVLEFQYGARQVISNYQEAYKYLIKTTTDSQGDLTITNIQDSGIIIYKYLCTEAKQIYKNAFPIILKEDIEDRKFLAVNRERFNPINFGIDYHKDGYDGFACFHRISNSMWVFSFYNDNKTVDCSKIAKSFGGGGHRGAAGCVVKDLSLVLN